eukprot:TRINITY_DN3248_c0_g1_i2.p1 TRINITY_DN3248_c0_g1~~TRINITY_DN3248_c0_g1_i2.p1  ORF type:complete len:761 (+),score=120.99 TRINITY_DN3248_c0_g1_i2:141-2423(+)
MLFNFLGSSEISKEREIFCPVLPMTHVQSSATTIGDLPDDCLLSIFAWSSAKELSLASVVCKTWNQLIHSDTAIWRRHLDKLPDQVMENRLRSHRLCIECHTRREYSAIWRSSAFLGKPFEKFEPWIARGVFFLLLCTVPYQVHAPLPMLLGMLFVAAYHRNVLHLQHDDKYDKITFLFRSIILAFSVVAIVSVLIVYRTLDSVALDVFLSYLVLNSHVYQFAKDMGDRNLTHRYWTPMYDSRAMQPIRKLMFKFSQATVNGWLTIQSKMFGTASAGVPMPRAVVTVSAYFTMLVMVGYHLGYWIFLGLLFFIAFMAHFIACVAPVERPEGNFEDVFFIPLCHLIGRSAFRLFLWMIVDTNVTTGWLFGVGQCFAMYSFNRIGAAEHVIERYATAVMLLCLWQPILIPSIVTLLVVRFCFSGLLTIEWSDVQFRCNHIRARSYRPDIDADAATVRDAVITSTQLQQQWKKGFTHVKTLPPITPLGNTHLSGDYLVGDSAAIDLHSGALCFRNVFPLSDARCVCGNRMLAKHQNLNDFELFLLEFPSGQLLVRGTKVRKDMEHRPFLAMAIDETAIIVVCDQLIGVFNFELEAVKVVPLKEAMHSAQIALNQEWIVVGSSNVSVWLHRSTLAVERVIPSRYVGVNRLFGFAGSSFVLPRALGVIDVIDSHSGMCMHSVQLPSGYTCEEPGVVGPGIFALTSRRSTTPRSVIVYDVESGALLYRLDVDGTVESMAASASRLAIVVSRNYVTQSIEIYDFASF